MSDLERIELNEAFAAQVIACQRAFASERFGREIGLDGAIGELQQALNDDNVISLKRAIRAIIWDYEEQRLSLLRRSHHPGLLPPTARRIDRSTPC